MKKFVRECMCILMLVIASVSISVQAADSVKGKVYEGNLHGLATFTFEFRAGGNVIFTAAALGDSESTNLTYEQDDSRIIVHAKNGDMILNQGSDGVLSWNMKGTIIQLTCQTPDEPVEKIDSVCGHVFSGTFGNGGRLALSFAGNGLVSVSINMNGAQQKESWPYAQEGDVIKLTEPKGRQITLNLNGRNELKGMFTIVPVTLSLVQ